MSADDVFDEDDIPAFLKADRDVNKIVDDLEDEDDFSFPSLDDDEDDDIGLPDDPVAEEPKPEPPKPPKAKETKADKQAKLRKPTEQTELKTALDSLDKIAKEEAEKPAKPGSNSGVIGDELKSFIERIERLEEERKSIGDDVKDVKAEAKGRGYDSKTIGKILKLRKQDKAKREEEEALLHLYMFALGME
jgi:uncharacterized protein (UPF0335 family)